MQLDSVGLNFIKQREGLRLNAYLDVAGVPTIGYGTTIYPNGQKVKLHDTCTLNEANMYFAHDIKAFELYVDSILINIPDTFGSLTLTTQNMFNSLVAICYNIGTFSFRNSTLLKRVNSAILRNDKKSISEAFLMWNKISVIRNGIKTLEVSPGLVNRRKKEIELYFS